MRGKKHPNSAKLTKDKDGKRHVVDPSDDLFAGGAQALEALFGKKDDVDDEGLAQMRAF